MSKDKLEDKLKEQYAPSKAYQKLFKIGNRQRVRKNKHRQAFEKHLRSKRLEAFLQQVDEEHKAFKALAFEKIEPIFQANDSTFFKCFNQWKNDKELQDGYPKIFDAFIKEAEYRDFIKYCKEKSLNQIFK